jgi:hypothetical protein
VVVANFSLRVLVVVVVAIAVLVLYFCGYDILAKTIPVK